MEWKERPRPAGPSSPGAIHFPSSSNPNRNSLEPNSSRTGLDLDRSPNLSINSDRGTSGGSGGTFLNLAARRSPIPGSGDSSSRRPLSYDHPRTPSYNDRSNSPPPSPSHSSTNQFSSSSSPSISRTRDQNDNRIPRTPPLSQHSTNSSNSSSQLSSTSNYLTTPGSSNSVDYISQELEGINLQRSDSNNEKSRSRKTPSTDYSLPYLSPNNVVGLGIDDSGVESGGISNGDFGLASRLKRSSVETKRKSGRSDYNGNGNGNSPTSSSGTYFPAFVPLTGLTSNPDGNGNSRGESGSVNSPGSLSPAFEQQPQNQRAPNRLRLSRDMREDIRSSNERSPSSHHSSNSIDSTSQKRYSNDPHLSTNSGQRSYNTPSTLSIADSIITTDDEADNYSGIEEENNREIERSSMYLRSSHLNSNRQFSNTSSGFGFDDYGYGRDEEEILNEEAVVGASGSTVLDRCDDVLTWDDITPETTHIIIARLANPSYIPSILEMAAGTMSHRLVVLDLSFNGLEEIPEVLGNCRSLQELDIKGNPLRSGDLPHFISNQLSLRVLIADQCELIEIKTNLTSLQHLHTLSLRSNRLSSLPGCISKLSGLEVLLVNDNLFGRVWTRIVKPILFETPRPPSIMSHDPKSARLSQLINGNHSIGSSPSSNSISSLGSSSSSSAKIGKMFSKRRPSLEARTFSEEPTTSQSDSIVEPQRTSRNIFGKKVVSSSSSSNPSNGTIRADGSVARTNLSRVAAMDDTRRRSFLPVQNYPVPTYVPAPPPVKSRSRNNSASSASNRKQSLLVDHVAGLKTVLAYLRDIDDLTPIEIKAPTPLSPPPNQPQLYSTPLRTYPSVNNFSMETVSEVPGSTRREKSGRLMTALNGNQSRTNSTNGYPSNINNSTRSITEDPRDSIVDPTNAPKPFELKLRSDPLKREQVLKEIVASEASYLRGLEELCEIYIRPGSVSVPVRGGRKDSMIPSVERRIVFGNLEDIRDFHERILLPDLEYALSQSRTGDAGPVASVFIQHAAVLKIYAPYVTAFDLALARLDTWSSERRSSAASSTSNTSQATSVLDASHAGVPLMSTSQRRRVKEFLKNSRVDPRHTQISLQSYLLLPIQRLPRYRMLLESLLSCTPVDDSQPTVLLEPHPVVQNALELISTVASDLNERKRESEGRQQLLYWQNRIGNKFRSPLVQPHRSMLRCETLELIKVVKQVITGIDEGPAYEGEAHMMSLSIDAEHKSIIALLCTDIMVFVHAPSDPLDNTGPVELFTVLRLAQPAGTPGPATLISESTLRIVCDSRAILYFQLDKRVDALSWMNAINLQQALNST